MHNNDITFLSIGAMLGFSSSLKRSNGHGYRTPFIFLLVSILRTGEQNEMFIRLFGNRNTQERESTQRFAKFLLKSK